MNENRLSSRVTVDWQKLKFIALWVFAIGLVAHGYCYFNGNFSHDSLFSIHEQSPAVMISSGRYLRPVYRLLRGSFTLPVINGFLFLCFLSISVYLLTDILNIQKKSLVALTCGLLTANSTIALMNATYLHDLDSYGLALLLALAGVWVSLHLGHGNCYAVLFYFASLGIYQAYIDVAIYVFLILALVRLLQGEGVKKVYLQTIRNLLPIAAGMVLYFLGILVTQHMTQVSGGGLYNDPTAALSLRSLSDRFLSCARALYLWFFSSAAHAPGVVIGANLLMLALTVLLLVALIRRRQLPGSSVWGIIGILILMPLGMNTVNWISNICHWLTVFACYLSYLCAPVLIELYDEDPAGSKCTRFSRKVWAVLAAVLIFDSCLYSNEISLKKELESAATLSTFTRIVDRMEQTEGFVPGQTEVAFVGLLFDSPLSTERSGFDHTSTGLWHSYSTTYYETYEVYLSYYLGYPAHCVDINEIQKYEKMEQIIAMPFFPAAGSVQMVEDVLVIKLSDVPG